MNKNKIKAYAPVARRELIAAVTAKAQALGLSATKVEPLELKGDFAMIAGRAFPRAIATPRYNLEKAIEREGFGQVMERMAYTWFNRFTALRYMELHGFLDHGYRVLSHPKGGNIPEILEHATAIELSGLDKAKVAELRMAGNKDAELYRLLLVAQCNALNPALPFLFERTNDETELLLPDNLLHSDSPIRKLVDEIEEADWKEVEIIGWLYQFYISEKKDEVIGKVVKSEDIPAATQLFTPNWIVKYLVQNTLGRQWLATYPNSPLRSKMEFYIEPAEQTEEVKAQLKAITPTELNPETLTFLDPACGSGHILVEAYDLFKEIYAERGYRTRDIPRLILEKNLFGLDIDERAAQLACFALMMKARADDRGLFSAESQIKLNVMAIQESKGLDADEIAHALLKERVEKLDNRPHQPSLSGLSSGKATQPVLAVTKKPEVEKSTIVALLSLFENAKTFGSLIRIPDKLVHQLPSLEKLVDPTANRDLAGHKAALELMPIVRQSQLFSCTFDHVVANPPYMGNKYLAPVLKDYLKKGFKDFEKDLFSAFIIRNLEFTKESGSLGFMSPFVWMFISSYEELRSKLIEDATISTLIQLEYSGFDGATVPICTFTLAKQHHRGFTGSYIKLSDFKGAENQAPKTLEAIRNPKCGWFFTACSDDFKKIPGSPIAYWISDKVRDLFERHPSLKTLAPPKTGISTGANSLYIFSWWEIPFFKLGQAQERWTTSFRFFPHNKAGGFGKWLGFQGDVLKYGATDLEQMQQLSGFRHDNSDFYFRESISWGKISSGKFSARFYPRGFTFNNAAICIFPTKPLDLLGFLNSKVFSHIYQALNETLNFTQGDVEKVPVVQPFPNCCEIVKTIIEHYKMFDHAVEISVAFMGFQILPSNRSGILKIYYENWLAHCNQSVTQVMRLESENNRLFIEAYDLQNELTPDVSEEQVTLTVNPKYRYGPGLTEEEYQQRFRYDTTKELLSYAVGCMMGRYSLDKPGLIYANTGNEGFDPSQYKTFPADDDGIVPVCDIDWFSDDATPRLVEFIKTVCGPEHLDDNLTWIADRFDPKKGETSVETIRRYFSTQFFKNHMQMYKKRPIYWLFSSGKQKAFECLVYLHRYNESTLSRMRAQYVTPLQGKVNARIEHLRREIDNAGSAAAKNKLRKEVESLTKKQTELAKFDEELRHYADQRIKLDLDEGVRVNYGKFGSLLAETKAITGGDEE